jgi:hypothetical protein
VTLGSLLKPYPQYTQILQRNTNGRKIVTNTVEVRAQRPFTKGASFFVAYAWNNERRQEWFDDLAQYKIFQTGQGWEWRATDQPTHRLTAALTWQLPIGRERALLSDMPAVADAILGGWQYTAATRFYSGRPVFFNQSLIVDGNPKVSNPTNDLWFDVTKFHGLQDTFTPRSNPWTYDGLVGPSVMLTDMTLTKSFKLTPKYKLEARLEGYNMFNAIVWDQPEVNVSSPNFGKVTRKRIDGTGREVQIGLRFVF